MRFATILAGMVLVGCRGDVERPASGTDPGRSHTQPWSAGGEDGSTAAVPLECSAQPCCGDPPRPCGEVLDAAIGQPCATACECGFPGLACVDGACRSGAEAVFCCDACPPHASKAQTCQRRDGSFSSCGAG